MIQKTTARVDAEPWQRELKEAFRTAAELYAFLGLEPPPDGPGKPEREFSTLVTRSFARRMRRGDADDPLLRQVLPTAAESAPQTGYRADPLDEDRFLADGLLRKYAGRALVVTTGACPVHCRYCFRRAFPYADHSLTPARRARLAGVLTDNPEVEEVILSGGDPLVLKTGTLASLFATLEAIPSVRRLRIHTRVPIALPSRIDGALRAVLARWPRVLTIVVHCNHPAEIDRECAGALAALRRTGCMLLNQSVLLRGVNDDPHILVALSERLAECGVLPYYLHMLDRVRGAAHFEVPRATAFAIHSQMKSMTSGYLVPRLVEEIPGAPAKTTL